MSQNPRISVPREVTRHLQEGEWAAAGDTVRHEGLKKFVESGLYIAGRSHVGRTALGRLAGEPVEDLLLRTNVAGLEMDGPVGIAPGWDKTGKTILAWQAAGARHISPGGIPPFPQAGNRMPRLRTFDTQIGDHGHNLSLNSFGFWSPGADRVVYNIQRQKELGEITVPIIAQITLNKEFYERDSLELIGEMVGLTVRKVLPIADAVSIGVTSPNTTGMRAAQDAGDRFLTRVVYAARHELDRANAAIPVIYKGDGDGGEERLEMYCKWIEYREGMIDAYELINTTALPHIKAKYGAESTPGGLAGADEEYQQLALEAVKYVYEAVGNRIDIIATGGCDSGEQALKMIENGGSAIGINSIIRKLGIRAPRTIERDLAQRVREKHPGTTSLDQVIGVETRRGSKRLTRESLADRSAAIAQRISEGTQSQRR